MPVSRRTSLALAALLAAVAAPAFAQQAGEFGLCAGVLTLENDRPVLLGPRLRSDGTQELARVPVAADKVKNACPPLAAQVVVPNGLGAVGNAPVTPTADMLQPTSVLYRRLPDSTVGDLGGLGRELQTVFRWRKDIQLRRESMESTLQQIRSGSAEMTGKIRADYNEAQSRLPELKTRFRTEISTQRHRLDVRATVDRAAAEAARNRMRDLVNRGELAAPLDPSRIGGLTGLLQNRQRSAEIESRIPVPNLRPPSLDSGSILGSVESYRWSNYRSDTGAGRQVEAERFKLQAAAARVPEDRMPFVFSAENALRIAQRFAEAGGAPRLVESLIGEARSLRFTATGLAREPDVATYDGDGATRLAPTPGLVLPENAVRRIAAEFETSNALLMSSVEHIQSRLADPQLDPTLRGHLEIGGQQVIVLQQSAGTAFWSGELEVGQLLMSWGQAVAEATLRIVPLSGWVIDAWETCTGRDAFNGGELSGFDRGMAVLGLATLGIGSKAKYAIKGLERVRAFGHARFQNIVRWTKDTFDLWEDVRNIDLYRGAVRGAPMDPKDFADAKKLTKHFDDHHKEFVDSSGNLIFRTEAEYLEGARKLARNESLEVVTIERAGLRGQPQVVRWDTRRGHFGVFDRDGTVVTFYTLSKETLEKKALEIYERTRNATGPTTNVLYYVLDQADKFSR